MVEHRDIGLALLGASAGIGGLILVFLGLVVSGVSAFQPGASPEVKKPYKMAALTVMAAFLLSVLSTSAATVWLLNSCAESLYKFSVAIFFVQLAALVAAAGHVFYRIVWSD